MVVVVVMLTVVRMEAYIRVKENALTLLDVTEVKDVRDGEVTMKSYNNDIFHPLM